MAKADYFRELWFILLALNKMDKLDIADNLYMDEYNRITKRK